MVIDRISGNCINLDESLEFITIQLKLDSLKGVSNLIKEIPPETHHQRNTRQNRNDGAGKRMIAGNISIIELLNDLSRYWYHLISATSQKRGEQNGNKYVLVKYVFVADRYDSIDTHFKEIRNDILSNLKRACVNTVWLGDVFLNPLYQEHKVVKGMSTVCINLSLHKDAKPAKGYKKVKKLWAADRSGKAEYQTVPFIATDEGEEIYNKWLG